MVEYIKEKVSGKPQITTLFGAGGILFQLTETLNSIKFGEFISTISTWTYGEILSRFGILVVGVGFILFDEDKKERGY